MSNVNVEGTRIERPSITEEQAFNESALASEVDNLIGALREDLIPESVQMALFDALSPSVQRAIVMKRSGLDANVVMVYQRLINTVEGIHRQMFTDDGRLRPGAAEFDLSLKDAMTLSLRAGQMLAKDLPKILDMGRVQEVESAVYAVLAEMPKAEREWFMERFEDAITKPSSL